MAKKETILTVYMDDEGNEAPQDQATRFVTLTLDKNGMRVKEEFGVIEPSEGKT